MSKILKRVLIAAAVLLFGVINISNFGCSDDDDFKFETYTVKPGDTFWQISLRYREKDVRNLYIFEYQDELRRLNPQLVKNGCQINPGDKIKVRYLER